MKRKFVTILFALGLLPVVTQAQDLESVPDTASLADRNFALDEVVVTGARNEIEVHHLSQTVSVIPRLVIEKSLQSSLLPVLTEQIPGLFTTSRGVMGYGVSNGAAGGISLRGLGGGNARLMVLIDGHPRLKIPPRNI